MSDKAKRQTRLLQKSRHIARQYSLAKKFGNSEVEPHRYAKRSGLTCGNANCVMCGNPRKFFKEETIQEKREKQPKLWIDDSDDSSPE